MKSMRALVVLILFCGLAPALRAQAPEWKEYRSESGRFVIEFPGTPTAQEQEDKDTGLMFHQFVVSGGGRLFFVLYTDYPEAEVAEKGADRMMDADRDNFVSGVKGKIDEEKRVACGEYPGRRLIITTEEGRWYALRICFASPRMYMILAGSRDGPMAEDGARFLNAFKILPKRDSD